MKKEYYLGGMMSHNFDQLLCKSSQSIVAPLTFLHYCYMILRLKQKQDICTQ